MKHLIDSVRLAVAQRNWYAALGMALTLPDVCGKLQNPKMQTGERYKRWCTTYLEPVYTRYEVGGTSTNWVFLSAADAYALRCAVLHEGRDDITGQAAREVLSRFQFTTFPEGVDWTIHLNQSGPHLQLQVDQFCEDICRGAEEWLAAMETDVQVAARIADLMTITELDPSRGFTIP